MIAENTEGVMYLKHSIDSVAKGKSGKDDPEESREELEEKLQATIDDKTSNWREAGDLSLFNIFTEPPVTRGTKHVQDYTMSYSISE